MNLANKWMISRANTHSLGKFNIMIFDGNENFMFLAKDQSIKKSEKKIGRKEKKLLSK